MSEEKASHIITVFEHETLRRDKGEKKLTKPQLKSLQLFYGEKGVPYYSLIHHGVKFKEFVGVIQIGKTVIEILPKADKPKVNTLKEDKPKTDKDHWREVLIGMLRAVGIFNIHAPSSSHLQLKANAVLDLYFELYVKELEYLLHRGLIKKYRKTEGNATVLKGSIQFAQHINKNLVHKERFYVQYSTYDKEHPLHAILYKALKLLSHINTHVALSSRLASLLASFPDMPDVKVTESLFERIVINRKTAPYKNAIAIARLLLLNYHPAVNQGNNHILALLFDMNVLWERFVYATLRKHQSNTTTVATQDTKRFWQPEAGSCSKIKPDIVLNKGKENCMVIDTKWKNLKNNPSAEDLRQMFVYMKYYKAEKVALVYPGDGSIVCGEYYEETTEELTKKTCSVVSIEVKNDKAWQKHLHQQVSKWCDGQ